MTRLAYTFTTSKGLELVASGSNNVSLHRLSSETRARIGSQASLFKA